jgi:hypothetical protein
MLYIKRSRLKTLLDGWVAGKAGLRIAYSNKKFPKLTSETHVSIESPADTAIMYLRLMPNLLHFLPDLGALYTLYHAPNFYEIHSYTLDSNKGNLEFFRSPCMVHTQQLKSGLLCSIINLDQI